MVKKKLLRGPERCSAGSKQTLCGVRDVSPAPGVANEDHGIAVDLKIRPLRGVGAIQDLPGHRDVSIEAIIPYHLESQLERYLELSNM